MRKLILPVIMAIATIFIFSSCADDDPATKLQNEVIEAHDIVMPQMITINKMADQLRTILNNKAMASSDDSISIVNEIAAFEKIDQTMHEWMAAFKMDTGDTVYLRNELGKINSIRSATDYSIAHAQKFIEIYNELD